MTRLSHGYCGLPVGMVAHSKKIAFGDDPMLFVSKCHVRGLRMCINYRETNKITVLNRYTLPKMDEFKNRVHGAKFFTKIDLKNRYRLIRIKVGDE